MELILWGIILFICFYILAKVVDEYFIESLDNIAIKLKLSPSVAGATLLAIGTSAPELSTALFAMFLPNSNPALGLGTIVGSAIFQILVVIGFAALVKTSYLDWKPVIRDGIFYALSIIALIIFIRDSVFTLFETFMFLLLYLAYLIVLLFWSKKVESKKDPDPIIMIEDDKKSVKEKNIFSYLFWPINKTLSFIPDCEKNKKYTVPVFLISLTIIAGLSYVLVVAAESIGTIVGIPSTIIALTILAGGSSVPELISSFIVSKQGRGDMAISNAIGSNIFDILISLGLPLFIYNLTKGELSTVGSENITSSILLLFATLISVFMILIAQKFKIDRKIGILLIFFYVLYVIAAYLGYL